MTDLMTGFWPSDNGSMPPDEPTCGFRNQRCTYTIEVVNANKRCYKPGK